MLASLASSDQRDIAYAAAASRLCVVSLAVLSDLLVPDHQAQGALLAPFSADCTAAAPLLRAFARWDAAHFLRVAQFGWQDDWSFAFFPGYPLLLRAASAVLQWPAAGLLCTQESMVMAGVLLSNGAFVVAACCL